MEGDEAYEEMSLSRLRQLVSAIPGAQRRKRGPDGKLKEKSKDELVATMSPGVQRVRESAGQASLRCSSPWQSRWIAILLSRGARRCTVKRQS